MTRIHPKSALAGLLLVMLAGIAPSAATTTFGADTAGSAQRTAEVPRDLRPEQIAPLLAQLTDVQARQLLAQELAERAARSASAGARGRDAAHGGFGVLLVKARTRLQHAGTRFKDNVEVLGSGLLAIPAALPGALDRMTDGRGLAAMLPALGAVLLAGAAGLWLANRALHASRARAAGAARGSQSAAARATRAAARAALDLPGLAAFAAVAVATAVVLYDDDPVTWSFVAAYLTGVLLVLAAGVLVRLLLAPGAPALRLLPLDDARARMLYRSILAFVAAATFAWLTAGLLILSGVPMAVHLAIVAVTGATMAGLGVALVLAFGARFRASGDRAPWIPVAAGSVIAVYLLWLDRILARGESPVWNAIGSLAVVASLPLAFRVFERFAPAAPAPTRIPAPHDSADGGGDAVVTTLDKAGHEHAAQVERRTHYLAVLRSVLRWSAVAVALLVLLEIWGVPLLGMAVASGALLRAAGVLIATGLLWLVFRALTRPYLPAPGASSGDEDGTIPRTRVETLLPLAYTTMAVLLSVFGTMIALSTLGVDIGPLLAGAGVVGLAIGFGAQTLVRDIVAGIFFLVDDAFRVGEYIEFDKLRGEVEAITLRSLKLRHHRGAIHTVPFGELRSVTNYSRDWVIYKMEFRLAPDTDVERLRKLIKKLGVELMEDPEFGSDFLQPLKSQGIAAVDENAIIMRCKFMSKPRKQFVLRRHCYHRLKQLFADEGIELAPRTVRVASHAAARTDDGPAAAAAVAEQAPA